ncbi:WD40/YVTN/BNR-like repeat-containing protein [Balneola vulgaris]|uniref:WD40/YVTN/BNR-like repeat-containing protein n=1 Tax=Balneola vulgaris TaxID=287535 RepID=UPI0012FC06AE|nr:hypothetical protein [Balneola vulgaris]
MKRVLKISLLMLVTVSCGLINGDKGSEKLKLPPYLLFEKKQLPISVFRGTNLIDGEIVHIFGDEKWLESTNHGMTFSINYNPDGVRFTKVLEFNDTYYALGSHAVNHPQFGDVDSLPFIFGNTNSIFVSDDAETWEQMIRMENMRDFIFQDDTLLHMGTDGGITTLNMVSDSSRVRLFYSSKLFDLINDFHITKTGTILAGCHDGIFRSTDRGENWERTSRPEISKNDDSIDHFYRSKDSIYAVGTKIHVSNDDGITWNQVEYGFTNEEGDFIEIGGEGVFITESGYIYSATYYGLLISRIEEPKNSTFILEHPIDNNDLTYSKYDEILAFKNGDIIVFDETLNQYQRGIKLMESSFWD